MLGATDPFASLRISWVAATDDWLIFDGNRRKRVFFVGAFFSSHEFEDRARAEGEARFFSCQNKMVGAAYRAMNEVTDGKNYRHGGGSRKQSSAPKPKGGGEKIVTRQKEGTTNDPREQGSGLRAAAVAARPLGRGGMGSLGSGEEEMEGE